VIGWRRRRAAAGDVADDLSPAGIERFEVTEAIEGAEGAKVSAVRDVLATAEPAEVKAVQAELGVERAGALVEHALARVAGALVEAGVRRLVVAGGETSGAVVQALGVQALRIGAPIDPGVPWTQALDGATPRPLLLALKSGNFGGTDFFAKALEQVS
jgi:uncharacterized protein YgbK (DUF1537 family)